MINVLSHKGPAANYDNENFNMSFYANNSKAKTDLLRNLSPKDLNIFQDELIVGDLDKYKFNKDTLGGLFDLGEHGKNGLFIDKVVDKSYSKAAKFLTQGPCNLTDEYVVENNRSGAFVGRKLNGEYRSMTSEPSAIRKNVAPNFDSINGSYNLQITYDIRDYHDHPEQLDYKELPLMRKCFGESLRKSDVKLMQDNITEIMSKECERRDAILTSDSNEFTKELVDKYYNSRVIDMMSDVYAISAVYQVEGQSYVFDKDFIDSMGPVYDDISSMVDKRLGLDQGSFWNLSEYARTTHDIEWKDLIRETQALYGVSEVEAKTGPSPKLPNYDFQALHGVSEVETKAKADPLPDLPKLPPSPKSPDSSKLPKPPDLTRPLPPLPPYDFGDGQQENEEPFDY